MRTILAMVIMCGCAVDDGDRTYQCTVTVDCQAAGHLQQSESIEASNEDEARDIARDLGESICPGAWNSTWRWIRVDCN